MCITRVCSSTLVNIGDLGPLSLWNFSSDDFLLFDSWFINLPIDLQNLVFSTVFAVDLNIFVSNVFDKVNHFLHEPFWHRFHLLFARDWCWPFMFQEDGVCTFDTESVINYWEFYWRFYVCAAN